MSSIHEYVMEQVRAGVTALDEKYRVPVAPETMDWDDAEPQIFNDQPPGQMNVSEQAGVYMSDAETQGATDKQVYDWGDTFSVTSAAEAIEEKNIPWWVWLIGGFAAYKLLK